VVSASYCALWLVATCLLATSPALGAATPPTHVSRRPQTPSAFDKAQRDREAFELKGPARTRLDFTRMLDEFRAIYHDNPHDVHAPAAIYAVAELLAEQGRQFDDDRSLRAAIGQYEFLRTQYPASSLRPGALLAEGRIERDDLGDDKAAKAAFRGVLKEAPHSETAGLAREELMGRSDAISTHRTETVRNGASTGVESTAPTVAAPSPPPRSLEAAAGSSLPAAKVIGPLAQVTGIRHWSTATYTRVAIDLGDEVTYEAARVPSPDRIFFDLHGAKLSPELVGKSFDVTDNGFLRRIRAAQAGPDLTRVVLDVNGVSEYTAFLLPNPYRLIIDIHGAKPAGAASAAPAAAEPVAVEAPAVASAAANRSGLPAMGVTAGVVPRDDAASVPTHREKAAMNGPNDPVAKDAKRQTSVTLGRPMTSSNPVPNTVAVKAPATAAEVADVGAAPGRVDATSAPTAKPIATAVKARVGERSGAAAAPVKAAARTADGETSLVRALGLKIGRIVIDPGHGGHDSGTLGVDGIEEKDVVLDVALRLGKLLHDRLGTEVVYTRSDDTFIPLETRTAIANKAQADLFLSIHANSSPDATARGVETYYLNFTSDANALGVAARENADSGQSVHQLSDLVKKIALKDKIDESREFAADVEGSLYSGLARGNPGLKNRGVKKAPFVVLIGANMPSVLAEISFVSNPQDAAKLRQPEYRQRVAESLYAGVAKYEGGLAGTRPVNTAVARGAAELK
jgi:N-acetylmuramoyl-L-alanine amidase